MRCAAGTARPKEVQMTEVTWFGHSAFRLSCEGASVLIDPFFAPRWGTKAADAGQVDVVLVTHDHSDHVGDAVAICRSQPGAMLGAIVGTAARLVKEGLPAQQVLNGIGFNMGGTVVCKGVAVTMLQAFHSSDSGMPAGYMITMPDGQVFYHAGDTCVFGDMGLWAQLYNPSAAFLPIGGVFTMDARQAARACRIMGLKKAVPMHYGTFPVLAQNPDEFRSELAAQCPDCACVAMRPLETIAF